MFFKQLQNLKMKTQPNRPANFWTQIYTATATVMKAVKNFNSSIKL
jgi:hypothetical protein